MHTHAHAHTHTHAHTRTRTPRVAIGRLPPPKKKKIGHVHAAHDSKTKWKERWGRRQLDVLHVTLAWPLGCSITLVHNINHSSNSSSSSSSSSTLALLSHAPRRCLNHSLVMNHKK